MKHRFVVDFDCGRLLLQSKDLRRISAEALAYAQALGGAVREATQDEINEDGWEVF